MTKKVLTIIASVVLCGIVFYWLCLIHWSVAMFLLSLAIIGICNDDN